MIKNLQSLRFVFIMLVVMSHIIGKTFDFGGECGVSFFFILSGFILSYAYGQQVEDGRFRHRGFVMKQLSKFYPLHVVTFLVMIVLDARLGRFFSWDKLVANMLLLQSWVPSDDFYFVANGLSWFLSDLLFFYAVFPMLYRMLIASSGQRLFLGGMVVLGAYLVMAASIPESLINPLLYAAPWTRLLDFAVGVLLYRLLRSEAGGVLHAWLSRRSDVVVSLLEIGGVLAVAASFFVYEHAPLRFRCTALFWLVLPAFLYGFVMTDERQRGVVTRLLHHPLMQWLGGISLEIYLVHWVTMRLLYGALAPYGVDEAGRLSAPVLLLTLIVIVAVSYLTKRFFVSPVYTFLVKHIK